MEGVTTAVLDEFPQLRANVKHKTLFLGLLCFGFYLMGLLLVTNVSASWPCLREASFVYDGGICCAYNKIYFN